MLTYRTGSAGGLAGARAMAEHLMEPTLPPGMAAAAAYYARTPGHDATGPASFEATLPRIREDLDPRLATLLGLDPARPPSADEIAHILAGNRADGRAIEGRTVRRPTVSLAEALGLASDRLPTPAEVERVLAGSRADTGEPLPPDPTRTVRGRFLRLFGANEATPPEAILAAMRQGRRADGAPLRTTAFLDALTASRATVAFVDLCLSADKSVSVAWALAETEAERGLLHAAHRDAVASTMKTIETVIGRARRGRNGRGGAELGRIGWLAFDHYTSRPTIPVAMRDAGTGEGYSALATVHTNGDPQLHSHIAVPSVVMTKSGHVGGLDLAQLAGKVHEWGGLYQAHIATNLRRLGVDVVLDPETGAARVVAVPETVRAGFSKRTNAGEAAARAFAASQGLDWDALDGPRRIGLLKQGTQGDPRAAKRDDLGDVASWRHQAEGLGWTPGPVTDLRAPRPLPARAERVEVAYEAAARILAEAFEGDAVLDESRARVAAARGLIASGIETADEIDDVAAELLARGVEDRGAKTALIAREVRGPRGEIAVRLTTGAHLDRETRLVGLAWIAAADRSGSLTVEEVDAGMAAAGLDLSGAHGEAQARAARALGAESGRIGVVVGAAGAGKTAMLAGLTRAWNSKNRTVYGTAVAWRQATALADAGIPEERCLALAALLARIRTGVLQLDADAVVVLDETSLVSTRDALDLLELREASGCTLVAVGDPLQGQAVEAGGVIGLLRRALGEAIPEISTTIRQRAQRERDLANLAREGKAADVLDALRQEGRARLAPGPYAEAVEAVADLWRERTRAGHGRNPLVVAPTHADCRTVAAAIRRRLQADGTLGPDLATLDAVDQAGGTYVLPVADGDKVRLYGRTYAQGAGRGVIGVNGSILEVRGITAAGIVLRTVSGREGLVPWGNLRDRETGRLRIGQGTVQSIAGAQGATEEECILAAPGGSAGIDAASFYVAMSRHRSVSWIVLGEGAERRAVTERRSIGDARAIRPTDIWSHAATTFSRRPQSETALDLMERAHVVRRGAEAVFRSGLARLEARTARGQAPTVIPRLGRRQRLALALEPLGQRIRARAQALHGLAAGAAVMPRWIDAAMRIARAGPVAQVVERLEPGTGPAPRP